MLLGNTTYTHPGAISLTEGIYLLPSITTHEREAISKLVARLEGVGAGTGRIRPVIYTSTGELVAVGSETVLAAPFAEEWIDLSMGAATGVILLPGAYHFGIWYGGNTGAVAMAETAASGGDVAAAAYSSTENPPKTLTLFGAVNPTIFAVSFMPFAPRSLTEDMEAARFPFELAQRAFYGTSGPKKSTLIPATTVGWHGVNFDVETGAFAIARVGGDCEDLVGHRIQVTRRYGVYKRSIALYCYAQRQFPEEVSDEDLSLTRRAFLALSGWEQDVIEADVEIML